MEKELLTPQEHLSSPSFLVGFVLFMLSNCMSSCFQLRIVMSICFVGVHALCMLFIFIAYIGIYRNTTKLKT